MTGKEHLAFGIASSAILALAMYDPNSIYFTHPFVLTATAAIGSVLPDIDTPESAISQRFPVLSAIASKCMKHRTYTHDLAFWSILGILICLKYPILLGLFIGYLGHLLLDGMTVNGISFFYLFYKKPIHLIPKWMRFKSSSITAGCITTFMIALLFACGKYFAGNLILQNIRAIIFG